MTSTSQKVGVTMNLGKTKIMNNDYVDKEDPDQTVTVNDTVFDEIALHICPGPDYLVEFRTKGPRDQASNHRGLAGFREELVL